MYMGVQVHHVLSVFLVTVLLVSTVSAQQKGVDIRPIDTNKIKPSSAIADSTQWVVDHIWFIIIFLGVGMGIFLFLFIWKRTVSKVGPFYENWKKTKKLCKMNKRWSVKDVYRVSGDTGLKWLGSYEGDCVLEDGSINVMWSNWKWGFWGKLIRWVFFPLRPLLKLFMKDFSSLPKIG
jgi:heme/copper-type cytochrome/quinol oxidase subunit 2